MATKKDDDLFARVVDGKIVEFPVFRIHITNRSHPAEWYTECLVKDKPEVPAFHRLERSVELIGTAVQVSYSVIPMTLRELFSLVRPRSVLDILTSSTGAVSIADIDPALVQRIYTLVSEYAELRLNDFALTRGYTSKEGVGSIDKLIGYKTSAVPSFAADAVRGEQLRDQTWVSLFGYFQRVMSGEVPVPLNIDDINAALPELTWE